MIRVTFIDGRESQLYDSKVIYDGTWLSGIDEKTKLMTFIPMARIHKFVELPDSKK